MVMQMIFTWKDSLFIAAMTAILILAGVAGGHAAVPPEQGYSSIAEGLNQPEDLGYEALLRHQLLTILETNGRDGLAGEVLPPPVPQKLLVFFDPAKTDLQPDAKLIVREAAAEAQRDKPNNVTVIQVTDSTGRAGSPTLAQQRAAVVRDELVRLGVPMDQIMVSQKASPPPEGSKVEIVYE
jgi:outer membrane protein OmpA-like peptidoglycan-associated protein